MKLTQLGSLYKLIRGESRNMRKSVAKQPRQRASAFVLESLENRVLLSATPMEVTTTEPVVTAAVVTTDKADYAPGETALITTSNTSADGLKFGDGELVQFQVTRTDGIEDAPMGNLPWYVTDGVGGFAAYQDTIVDSNNDGVAESGDRNADGMADWIRPDNDLSVNGSISTDWYVEDQYLGASLLLTATGQASGAVATTEFTDSPRVGTVTVGSQSGVLISGVAGSTNYTFNVFRGNNNNNAAPATVAITGLPAGVTVSGLTTSITLAATGNSTTSAYSGTFTLNTPLSLTASSYSFNVTVTANQGNNDSETGAGSLVVSPATVATTTTVSSSLNSSTYGDAVTFTATVARTTGTGAPTGSVTFNIAGIGTGLVGTAGATTATTATWTYTTTATALTAGNHVVQAFYAHSGSFTDSTSANITQTVNKAIATVNVTGYTGTYDAAAHGASGTVVGVDALGAAVGSSLNLGDSFTNYPGGTANWTFTGGTNYTDQNGTAAITINKAIATVNVTGYTGTYDAAAHGASGTVVGVDALGAAVGSSLNLGDSFTNYPGGTANWTFTGGTNYTDQNGTAAITINKAIATVNVTGYTGTYDAAAHGASGTVVGVDALGAAVGSSLNLGDSFTNYPGGTANWTFTGGTNYTDQNGTAAITINKAIATVNVTGYTGTYDAAAHGASGTVVGVDALGAAVGSSLNLGDSFTNYPGGTANWTFTGGTNYTDQNGTAAITINKAIATVNVTGYTGTYDAAAHGASGTVVGVDALGAAVGSSLNLGDSFTNYPGGTANWTFTGGTNYTDQNGTAAITINKAIATVNVTGYTGTYDAAAHGASGTVVGVDALGAAVGSSLNLGDSFTNYPGGTANWTFTGGTNYTDQNGTAAIVINKASSTTTNNGVPSSAVYTGSAQGISGTTVTGAGGLATVATSTVYYDTLGTVATGDDVLLGGAPTNAGSYKVVSTYLGDLNHTGSYDTDYFSIGKATLTGVATTQSALNIAKQGALVFSLNSVTGMVDGDTLVSLLSSMSFTLKIGVNTYAFAPSVAIDTHGDGDASNDTVVVTYSLKNGGDAGQLAFDLQALNTSDGTASTSASNAQVDAIFVNMSTANYTFSDDALTKLFYSLK